MFIGNIKIHKLCEEISESKKFVLYGIGHLAEVLLTALEEQNLHPAYCVVTDKKNNEDSFHDIPVYGLADRVEDIRNDDVIVIIAVTEMHEDEIIHNLIQNNIHNYLKGTDFSRNSHELSRYMNKSKQECLYEIAEWYVDCCNLKNSDIEEEKNTLEKIINKDETDKKKIVFLIDNLSPRVVKIATALKKKGFAIQVIFGPRANLESAFKTQVNAICGEGVCCNTLEEVMYRLIISKAFVIHLFTQIGNSDLARVLIYHKELFPKIVFDQYDIANGMYADAWFPKERNADEKYCMENADGICCRGYEQEYLIENLGFKIKGKLIKFFDYCSGNAVSKKKSSNDELTLCYAGGISTEHTYPDAPYACFLELAEICEKNKCHFHVYPAIWYEDKFADYIKLDKDSEYFHFHKPVPYNELYQELSQYDYGIHPIRNNFLDKEISGYTTKNKMIFAVANHMFDYIDAGLPIITAYPVKFVNFFEREGILIKYAIEDLDFEQLKLQRNEMHKNVMKAHEKLCIDRHIDELIQFYNSL